MGLFNDNVNPNRTSWTFRYMGQQLEQPARKLLEFHTNAEIQAREIAASLLRDSSVSHNDTKIVDAKKAIERHGSLREQLEVWVHEFHRNPTLNFELGLGDVTFFELQK